MAQLTVYELPDRLFILQASAIRIATPGYARPLEVGDEDLGELILGLVAHELPMAPDIAEEERRQLPATILRESGYRTWLSLDKNAKLCAVSGNVRQVEITPLIGRQFPDRKKGFQEVRELTVRLEGPGAETIGKTVREALRRATRLP